MKAWDDDGYWYLHVSGGRVGETIIEPEDVGPLTEPPRTLLEWTQPESSAVGAGSTTFTRFVAGAHIFTVRHCRWRSATVGGDFEFEVVMRAHDEDAFVNPDPPPWATPDEWDNGRLVL